MKLKNQNGMAMIFVLVFFVTASYGLTSLLQLGGSGRRTAKLNLESSKAYFIAEAGAERAKIILRDNYETTPLGQSADTAFGEGEFYYTIANSTDPTDIFNYKRVVTGIGAYPDSDDPVASRAVEVVVRKPPTLPFNFWDYAIYTAGNIRGNGNTYDVFGDVVSGGDISYSSQDRFAGTETEDPAINPLIMLDFEILKAIAQTQVYDGHDNYYTADEIGDVAFPADFYFTEPTETEPGIPNVVFVEGNLALNGNWADFGGFIIVVGDILTDPDATGDTSINGNGTIDGVVYTLGTMTTNGGGGGLNVNGGVFAADNVTMNGNTNVTYNQEYMEALDSLGLDPGMTVLSWKEVGSPL